MAWPLFCTLGFWLALSYLCWWKEGTETWLSPKCGINQNAEALGPSGPPLMMTLSIGQSDPVGFGWSLGHVYQPGTWSGVAASAKMGALPEMAQSVTSQWGEPTPGSLSKGSLRL